MKVAVLASGSKGNCGYIETDYTKSLVDIGMSCSYVEKSLRSLDVEPSSIQQIFITHTHTDHIGGLRVFIKKYNPKVYLTEKMHKEIDFEISNYDYIDDDLLIDDLSIIPVKTSHDVADSNGYVFSSNKKSVVYITDTGYIHVKNFKKLVDKDLYIFESNHDIRMLKEGKYPNHLQQIILSDKGQLYNKDSANYLYKFVSDKKREINFSFLLLLFFLIWYEFFGSYYRQLSALFLKSQQFLDKKNHSFLNRILVFQYRLIDRLIF